MPGDVGERFPGDPVHGGAGRSGEIGDSRRDRRGDLDAGAAVLVDEGVEIGGTGKRRIGPPLVGAQGRHRGADLIEAGPPDALGVGERPLGIVEVAPQDVASAGDVEEHRRQRVAGEIVELAGDAPPLLGDGLLGERLTRLFAARRSACLLAVHDATDGEREGVGQDPRLPADVLSPARGTRR